MAKSQLSGTFEGDKVECSFKTVIPLDLALQFYAIILHFNISEVDSHSNINIEVSLEKTSLC